MLGLLLALFLLFFLMATAMANEGLYNAGSCQMMLILTIFLMIDLPDLFGGLGFEESKERRQPRPHRKRVCCTVMSILTEMGPNYVHHAYQMHAESFWKLHSILRLHLERRDKRSRGSNEATRKSIRMVLRMDSLKHQ
jgi:hypothetical protein